MELVERLRSSFRSRQFELGDIGKLDGDPCDPAVILVYTFSDIISLFNKAHLREHFQCNKRHLFAVDVYDYFEPAVVDQLKAIIGAKVFCIGTAPIATETRQTAHSNARNIFFQHMPVFRSARMARYFRARARFPEHVMMRSYSRFFLLTCRLLRFFSEVKRLKQATSSLFNDRIVLPSL